MGLLTILRKVRALRRLDVTLFQPRRLILRVCPGGVRVWRGLNRPAILSVLDDASLSALPVQRRCALN
jgi:hypothetical protein